jgi:cation-transporting ATPase 13A1
VFIPLTGWHCNLRPNTEGPIDHPIGRYVATAGISSPDLPLRVEQYGKNLLAVAPPNFIALYKQQLLSPLAMFQFFTSALWMMDEYWQYTLFSVFNILMFESTTVFQRLKTLNTLNGMSTKPYPIKVWREQQWQEISTEQLLPGDLIWVKRSHQQAPAAAAGGAAQAGPKKTMASTPTDIVPCDCLMLRGSAVVNEATLTGESIPQMKDAIVATSTDTRKLDFEGQDRVHVLFSGTSLVSTISGGAAGIDQQHSGALDAVKLPEGNGCLCYVLRTGFNSSQGELIQMIEYSTQRVSADSKETLAALGILLVFALVAAAYVFQKGLAKGDKTTHALLLKCVIIITSVVPQQLPMQMALAVNTALMALMKKGVFCTEPYRVQFAGKVSHCLFDKTGTLTTDQMVPAGVLCADKTGKTAGMIEAANKAHVEPKLDAVSAASVDAGMVMGACHSLVSVEGQGMVGDPIELAGLAGVGWSYNAEKELAAPGDLAVIEKGIIALRKELAEGDARRAIAASGTTDTPALPAPTPTEVDETKKKLATLSKRFDDVTAANTACPVKSVHIVHRHRFSSKLQRMSVLCDVTGQNGGNSGACCLVKGSPEAIGALLAPGAKPEWYDNAYRLMAEKGKRVLALAYKWVNTDGTAAELGKKPRDWVECNLTFAGFIAFECKNRADSGVVVKALQQSSHSVAMVTGDAPLTALHVAVTLGICAKETTALSLTYETTPTGPKCKWVGAVGEARFTVSEPFASPGVVELSKKYELITTEDALNAAAEESNGELWKEVDVIHVFARMSPQGKANIIRMIQLHKEEQVLMCGDGGNDVGALKQADCGMALLGGYGNSNTEEEDEETKKKKAEAELAAGAAAPAAAEDELNAKGKEATEKMAKVRKVRCAFFDRNLHSRMPLVHTHARL